MLSLTVGEESVLGQSNRVMSGDHAAAFVLAEDTQTRNNVFLFSSLHVCKNSAFSFFKLKEQNLFFVA